MTAAAPAGTTPHHSKMTDHHHGKDSSALLPASERAPASGTGRSINQDASVAAAPACGSSNQPNVSGAPITAVIVCAVSSSRHKLDVLDSVTSVGLAAMPLGKHAACRRDHDGVGQAWGGASGSGCHVTHASRAAAVWPGLLQRMCCLLGAKPEVLCTRFRSPWFALGAIYFNGAAMVILMLATAGLGTHWDPVLTGVAAVGAAATVLAGVHPSRQVEDEVAKSLFFKATLVVF